ncbi:MAG: DUF6338 family protein [Terracidiphilus sp.]|jgi:hypothetical protein
MPATLLAPQVFLILLRGFSAAYIVQALATRRQQSDLERVIEAIVFSFVIYLCSMLGGGRLPFHILHDSSAKIDDAVIWEPSQLMLPAAVTLVFAVASLAYVRFDGSRLFQKLRLTERTTRNSIWNDVFESEATNGQPLQVELADGRSVIGNLVYYSDVADDASVYLTQASWVTEDRETVAIPGSGILLTKSSGIRSISLLDPIEGTAEGMIATADSE